MRNRMYGGVRGRKTKVGRKLQRFPPTRFHPTGINMMDKMDVRDIIRSFRNLCLSLHRKYEIGGRKALTRTSNST